MRKFWLNLWLIAIVLLGGWLRCRDLDVPATYMFDEVYHIPTINLIARGHPWAWEWWHLELTDFESIGVDTPEDLEKINNLLNNKIAH